MAGVPVADALFLIRFYERRQFSLAGGGELYFLPDIYGRDPALLRALDAEFEFVPPAGYEESLSRVSSP